MKKLIFNGLSLILFITGTINVSAATVSSGLPCGSDNAGSCMKSNGIMNCPYQTSRIWFGGDSCETSFICCETTEATTTKEDCESDYQACINSPNNDPEECENQKNTCSAEEKAGTTTEKKSGTITEEDINETLEETSTKLELSDTNYDLIIKNNQILSIIKTDENDSVNTIQALFSGKIITIVNIIIGAVALIWLFVLGIKFIFSQGKEDEMAKYKEQFGWIVAGLTMISAAEFIGFSVFDPTQNLAENEVMTNNFYTKLMQIKLYFQYFVGGLMLINGIRSGYNLITISDGGEDESIQKEKTFITSLLFGTVIILLSEVLVTGVFFINEETVSAAQGIYEISGLINFAISFSAGIATFMMVLASLYYVTSLGDEDRAGRAKKIIISCVVALIILFSAYTFVRFLL